jgi:phosphatidylglycerol lysyltransferase
MAAAAVSQTAGFGPVVGAIVRRRLLPELTMAQSFAVSACMTVGFFGGIGLLALAAAALVPGMPHQCWSQMALALAVVAVLGWSGLRRPNLLVLGRFLGWLTVDLTALALALWLVLPDALAFWVLWPVFLMALGVGIASGSPGGVGPFEAAMLALLPGHAEGLVAGIIAFRVLVYLVPALCGAVWALRGAGSEVAAAVPGEMRHMALMGLRALPSEAQLIRQGALTLLCHPEPVWLSGRLNHTRVGLGPVLSGGGRRRWRCWSGWRGSRGGCRWPIRWTHGWRRWQGRGAMPWCGWRARRCRTRNSLPKVGRTRRGCDASWPMRARRGWSSGRSVWTPSRRKRW